MRKIFILPTLLIVISMLIAGCIPFKSLDTNTPLNIIQVKVISYNSDSGGTAQRELNKFLGNDCYLVISVEHTPLTLFSKGYYTITYKKIK